MTLSHRRTDRQRLGTQYGSEIADPQILPGIRRQYFFLNRPHNFGVSGRSHLHRTDLGSGRSRAISEAREFCLMPTEELAETGALPHQKGSRQQEAHEQHLNSRVTNRRFHEPGTRRQSQRQ